MRRARVATTARITNRPKTVSWGPIHTSVPAPEVKPVFQETGRPPRGVAGRLRGTHPVAKGAGRAVSVVEVCSPGARAAAVRRGHGKVAAAAPLIRGGWLGA